LVAIRETQCDGSRAEWLAQVVRELLAYYRGIQRELGIIAKSSILDIVAVADDWTSESNADITAGKILDSIRQREWCRCGLPSDRYPNIVEKSRVDHEVALMSKSFKAKLTQLLSAWRYTSLIKRLGTSDIAWPLYLLKRVTRRFRTQWKFHWQSFSSKEHKRRQLNKCSEDRHLSYEFNARTLLTNLPLVIHFYESHRHLLEANDRQDLELLKNEDVQAVFQVMTYVMNTHLLPFLIKAHEIHDAIQYKSLALDLLTTINSRLQTDLSVDLGHGHEVDLVSEVAVGVVDDGDGDCLDFIPLDDENFEDDSAEIDNQDIKEEFNIPEGRTTPDKFNIRYKTNAYLMCYYLSIKKVIQTHHLRFVQCSEEESSISPRQLNRIKQRAPIISEALLKSIHLKHLRPWTTFTEGQLNELRTEGKQRFIESHKRKEEKENHQQQ